VIIAGHVLHHVGDIPRALREIRRILKPRGVLYASAVGANHLKELRDMVLALRRDAGDSSPLPRLAFTLESGFQPLAECFGHVRLHRYPDEFRVTEAAPLVDYVGSGFWTGADFDSWRNDFEQMVSEMICDSGAIHISKDSGLFEARRG
jgi:SAM-dependent methyltransferase